MYRVVQKKGTVLLSTSLAWPAVAGCSRAETFSQLSSISFAQPCTVTSAGSVPELKENPVSCLQTSTYPNYERIKLTSNLL